MLDTTNAPATYYHPKNIKIGRGRVLWSMACVDTSGRYYPEGWVLLGGERTSSYARAESHAKAIDVASPKEDE